MRPGPVRVAAAVVAMVLVPASAVAAAPGTVPADPVGAVPGPSAVDRTALPSLPAMPAPLAAARPVRLKNHEPTMLGYTRDSDDDGFMDVSISLQHPLFAGALGEGNNRFNVLPYFAATVRFAQYLGTRDSSPVVTKRFNPKLFLRWSPDGFPADGGSPSRYVDFEYAHESNGQSANSAASFEAAVAAQGGNRERAKDYISRGWDYLGITGKLPVPALSSNLYLSRKWYCGCLLQGEIEEFYDFEAARKVRAIKQVAGWRAILKADLKARETFFDQATLIVDTGTRETFKYNTVRLELGLRPLGNWFGVPFVAWAQTGRLSDLAQYDKPVTSFGGAFVFETFGR